LTSLALVLALAVVGAVSGSVASAATGDVPVSNLALSGGAHTPLVVGDTVTLTGDWGPVDNPQNGDNFTVTLPSVFKSTFMDGQTFNLGTSPTYGTCVISNSSTVLTCTLNGDHSTLTGVGGKFGLQLKATGTTTEDHVEFQTSGGPLTVTLPGGPISDGSSLQTGFTKVGALQSNKWSVKWTVTIGGDSIAGMPTVTVNDDLTGGSGAHTLCAPAPTVTAQGRNTTAPGISVNKSDPSKPIFTLTAPTGGFDSNTKYVITYYTCTPGNLIDPKDTTYYNSASFEDKGGSTQSLGPKIVTQDWELPSPVKTGAFLTGTDRYQKIRWTVDIPGSLIKGTGQVDLADTLGADQALCSPTADYGLGVTVGERYGPNSGATITSNANIVYNKASDTAFTITLNSGGTGYSFKDSPYVYRVTYTTCVTTNKLPDFDTKFTNSVVVKGKTAPGTVTMPTWKTGKTGTINGTGATISDHNYPANTTIGWTVTIPGQVIEGTSPLTFTDTPSATQAVCTPNGLNGTTDADLKTRLGLTAKAIDQVDGGGEPEVDLLSDTSVSLNGSDIVLTITPPVGHFSREYQYKVLYTLCTASGGVDAPDTAYSNQLTGVGNGASNSVKLSNDAWGTGSGVLPVSSGSFALTKTVKGDAASRVATTDFTVNVKEIPPTGSPMSPVSYTLTVKDGQTVSGLHALGTGWTVELEEATLPTASGVWHDPVFTPATSGDSNVVISDAGKKATITPVPGGTNVGVALTNTLSKTFAVGDYVWVDTNKDGLQGDPSVEPPLEGVKVELFKADGRAATDVYGNTVPATTTNAAGLYMFDELPAGDYKLKFTLTPEQAAKYRFTTMDAQSNGKDKEDSDANSSGWTVPFTLDSSNDALTHEYESQRVKATEGIDPTWDAGVILRPTGGDGTTETTTTPTTAPTTPVTTPTTPVTTPTTGHPTTTLPPVTTTVPAPNQCADLVETGFRPGETVTVRVTGPDGQYELSATADANGTVHVCLRASHPKTVTVEVLGENRQVVREVTIGVLGAGGSLPNTGVPMWSMIGVAMLLLAAGGALAFGFRRKHAH
jgi:LPXTG-motif cell wall-anchored protein